MERFHEEERKLRRLERVGRDIYEKHPVPSSSAWFMQPSIRKQMLSTDFFKGLPKDSEYRKTLVDNLKIFGKVRQFIHKEVLRSIELSKNERKLLKMIIQGNYVYQKPITASPIDGTPSKLIRTAEQHGIGTKRLEEILAQAKREIGTWTDLARESEKPKMDHVMRRPLEYYGSLAAIALQEAKAHNERQTRKRR
ncbi:MAG: hypothetical protein WC792_02725 [Candidatus Micrarchaeia archaeon]|jgi:hypothetical protein